MEKSHDWTSFPISPVSEYGEMDLKIYGTEHEMEDLSDVDLKRKDPIPTDESSQNSYHPYDRDGSRGNVEEKCQSSVTVFGEYSPYPYDQGEIGRDHEKTGENPFEADTLPRLTPPPPEAPSGDTYYDITVEAKDNVVRNPKMHRVSDSMLPSSLKARRSIWAKFKYYVDSLYSSPSKIQLREYCRHAGHGCTHCQHNVDDYEADLNPFDRKWVEFKQKDWMRPVCAFCNGILLAVKILLLPIVWPLRSSFMKKVRHLIQFISYFPMMVYTALVQLFIFLLLALTVFLVIYFWDLITDPARWIKGKALFIGHETYCKVRYEFNKIEVLPDLPDADPPYACPTPRSSKEKRAEYPYTMMATTAYDTTSASTTLPANILVAVIPSATAVLFPKRSTSSPTRFIQRQYSAPTPSTMNHSVSWLSRSTLVTTAQPSPTSAKSNSASTSYSSLTEPTRGTTSNKYTKNSISHELTTTIHKNIFVTDTIIVDQTLSASGPEESITKPVVLFTLDTGSLIETTTALDLTTIVSSAAANRQIEIRRRINAISQSENIIKRRLATTTSTIQDGAVAPMSPRDFPPNIVPPKGLNTLSNDNNDRDRRHVQGKRFDLPVYTDARVTSYAPNPSMSTSFTSPTTVDSTQVHDHVPISTAVPYAPRGLGDNLKGHISNIEGHANSALFSIVSSAKSEIKEIQTSAIPSMISKGEDAAHKLEDEVKDGFGGLLYKVLDKLNGIFEAALAIIPTNYSECIGCERNDGNASTISVGKRAVLLTARGETQLNRQGAEPLTLMSAEKAMVTMILEDHNHWAKGEGGENDVEKRLVSPWILPWVGKREPKPLSKLTLSAGRFDNHPRDPNAITTPDIPLTVTSATQSALGLATAKARKREDSPTSTSATSRQHPTSTSLLQNRDNDLLASPTLISFPSANAATRRRIFPWSFQKHVETRPRAGIPVSCHQVYFFVHFLADQLCVSTKFPPSSSDIKNCQGKSLDDETTETTSYNRERAFPWNVPTGESSAKELYKALFATIKSYYEATKEFIALKNQSCAFSSRAGFCTKLQLCVEGKSGYEVGKCSLPRSSTTEDAPSSSNISAISFGSLSSVGTLMPNSALSSSALSTSVPYNSAILTVPLHRDLCLLPSSPQQALLNRWLRNRRITAWCTESNVNRRGGPFNVTDKCQGCRPGDIDVRVETFESCKVGAVGSDR